MQLVKPKVLISATSIHANEQALQTSHFEHAAKDEQSNSRTYLQRHDALALGIEVALCSRMLCVAHLEYLPTDTLCPLAYSPLVPGSSSTSLCARFARARCCFSPIDAVTSHSSVRRVRPTVPASHPKRRCRHPRALRSSAVDQHAQIRFKLSGYL